MNKLLELIMGLMRAKFYGELSLKFQSGQICHVEKKESLDVSQFQPKQ